MRILGFLRSRKTYSVVLVVAVVVIAVWLLNKEGGPAQEAQLPSESPAADTAYSEAAKSGEGVSHLAARALNAYLGKSEVKTDAVQHLWAVNRLSATVGAAIHPGQVVEFFVSAIERALADAKALTAGQRASLLRYIR